MPARHHRADWEWQFARQLGANIVAARQAQSLNGAEFARLLGVNAACLWHWEQGLRCMAVTRLQTIADALAVPAAALLPKIGDP